MAQTPPDKTTLFEWLDGTIDSMPNKGQILLNFDGDTIAWEVKGAFTSTDPNGHHERVEVRRFGRLHIQRVEVGTGARIYYVNVTK